MTKNKYRYADVKIDVDTVSGMQNLNRLQYKKVPNAAARSLNDAAKSVRTYLSRSLSKTTSMGIRKAWNKMELYRATAQKLSSTVLIKDKGKWPNLASQKPFRAPIGKSGRKGKKAGKRAWGARSKAWGKSRFYKSVFAWKRGTSLTAFARVGSSEAINKRIPTKRTGGDRKIRRFKRGPKRGLPILRQRIKAIYGPDIIKEFIRERTNERPQRLAKEVFEKKFIYHMKVALKKS